MGKSVAKKKEVSKSQRALNTKLPDEMYEPFKVMIAYENKTHQDIVVDALIMYAKVRFNDAVEMRDASLKAKWPNEQEKKKVLEYFERRIDAYKGLMAFSDRFAVNILSCSNY